MLVRIPLDQLARSQICVRMGDNDSTLSYEVQSLPDAAGEGRPLPPSPHTAILAGVELHVQTIFDDNGRRQGFRLSTSLLSEPSQRQSSPWVSSGYDFPLQEPSLLDETFNEFPTQCLDSFYEMQHNTMLDFPHYYQQLDTLIADFGQDFNSVFDAINTPSPSSSTSASSAETPNAFCSPLLSFGMQGSATHRFSAQSDSSCDRGIDSAMEPTLPTLSVAENDGLPFSAATPTVITEQSTSTPPAPSPHPNSRNSPVYPFSSFGDPVERKPRCKRYPCLYPTCTRVLTNEYTRKVHMETHNRVRKVIPCTVPGCAQHFSRMHDRLRHEVTQHGKASDYSCQVCHRFFSSDKFLRNHKCPGPRIGTQPWLPSEDVCPT